jgi:hypothetical protein
VIATVITTVNARQKLWAEATAGQTKLQDEKLL